MASTIPSSCRTWQYTKTTGGIEKNLKLNSTAPVPTPSPTEHLVKVIAAALNPVDHKPVEHIPLLKRLATSHAATPGLDFAGVVVKLATKTGTSTVKVGDIVFGVSGSGSPFAGGALSEYAVAGEANCLPVPDGVAAVDAATVGVAGLTAYQSILPYVKAGDKVFINGGSGGTGCFGIQVAKAHGCYVATCCSERNVELCRSLGADRVIDYTKGKVWEQLKASGDIFDHIVDNVGADEQLYYRCHEFSKPTAQYIMVAGQPTLAAFWGQFKMMWLPSWMGGGQRKFSGFWPKPDVKHLTQIAEWMKEGKVRAVIEERFKMEDAPKAFERLKTNRARGKVVVDIVAQESGKGSSS